jgi:hypothetical protein
MYPSQCMQLHQKESIVVTKKNVEIEEVTMDIDIHSYLGKGHINDANKDDFLGSLHAILN